MALQFAREGSDFRVTYESGQSAGTIGYSRGDGYLFYPSQQDNYDEVELGEIQKFLSCLRHLRSKGIEP